MLLLVALAACGPAATPTVTPIAPTPTDVAAGQPTDTPASPSPTEPPTEEATPTEEEAPSPTPSPTPAPAVNVGDLEWKQVGLAGTDLQDIALHPAGNNPALVTGPGGAWQSKYDYSAWEELGIQMQGRITSAAIGSPDLMYITSHTGCLSGAPIEAQRTSDGGQSWQSVSTQAQPLEIAAATGNVAFGATCTGIVKSTDAGATWVELPNSRDLNFESRVVVSSPDGQSVFAAHYSEGGSANINQSLDGGATWTDITPTGEEMRAPIMLFYVPGSVGRPEDGGLYMASYPNLIWFLTQGGEAGDWKLFKGSDPRTDSPTGAGVDDIQITALYVDTAYSEEYNKPGPVIYVARAVGVGESQTGEGVYRSIDMGMTWEQVGKGLGRNIVTGLALAPHDPFASPKTVEMLLATTGDGVWAVTMPPPFR
jgi:photosystem II stability/assembly factor-like uncharacterized protein